MELRLTGSFSAEGRAILRDLQRRLPVLRGAPVSLVLRPQLTAHRGKLLSGQPGTGTAVHAATFIRERRIVLETELLRTVDIFQLVVTHELFHFVWVRLGNPLRRSFGEILLEERRAGSRGEMGESAAVCKGLLRGGPCDQKTGRRWREYVCESFCDTAAWCCLPEVHNEHLDLAKCWRGRRQRWFRERLPGVLSC